MDQCPQAPDGHPAVVVDLDRNAAAVIDSTIAAAHRHDAQDRTTTAVQLAEELLAAQLNQHDLAFRLSAFALHVARQPEHALAAEPEIRPWSARWARMCGLLAAPVRSGADFDTAVEGAIGAARCFDGVDQGDATVRLGRYLTRRMPHRWQLAFTLAALAVHAVRPQQLTSPAEPGRLQAGLAQLRAALRRVTQPAPVTAPSAARPAGEGRSA